MRKADAAVLLALVCVCCDSVQKGFELIHNRYKIVSPSMSPTLNVGENYSAFSADTFGVNQIVIFNPPPEVQSTPDGVWVSRLVAKAGDVIEMRKGELFLNGERYPFEVKTKHSYLVKTSVSLNEKRFEKFEYELHSVDTYRFFSTPDEIQQVKKNGVVKSVTSQIYDETFDEQGLVVPGNNRDNWGPITIPGKNDEVTVSDETFELFRKVARFEQLPVPQAGEKIKLTHDYFFILGDNRHNSYDSRYLGLIPDSSMKGYLVVP
jgi:signal peptidase I